ncbi:Hypothetical protein Nlim_1803 [Candidatus Nitrosarchaeum limnium SFB1]|uniref:Uncharacterized protein n=1 Tax=Candidatus Nitrosarchaeum limnium SFB1 TaxID=886738 RepID=F3KMQ2_9ARCH|nr:Hypothetical protein Nlim_1803 [Candidatus Nitrosarchaeum limnium SFB1]
MFLRELTYILNLNYDILIFPIFVRFNLIKYFNKIKILMIYMSSSTEYEDTDFQDDFDDDLDEFEETED